MTTTDNAAWILSHREDFTEMEIALAEEIVQLRAKPARDDPSYPINHHILAEDFREQQAGRKTYNQGDGEWLHDALLKMCDAFDKLIEERDRLQEDLNLSVCYAPGAIRDSFDAYEEDDENKLWVEQASDEQLMNVAYMIIGSDPIWSRFHEDIEMCVEEVRTRKE